MSVAAIEAGSFMMGSEEGHPHRHDDEALHETELTRGFFIGETEVTQAQFKAYMGYDPVIYNADCGDCPVQEVSWDESAAFTNAMSDAHGLERCYACEGEGLDVWCQASMNPYECPGYRMPTEAEWEYAAHGGERFEYPASDDIDEVGWWKDNSGMTHHPVALLEPNGFGIYDMAGNVREFVNDWYENHPGGTQVDPWLGRADVDPNGTNHEPTARAVEKGGSFACVADQHRPSCRHMHMNGGRMDLSEWFDRDMHVGFRVARTAP